MDLWPILEKKSLDNSDEAKYVSRKYKSAWNFSFRHNFVLDKHKDPPQIVYF